MNNFIVLLITYLVIETEGQQINLSVGHIQLHAEKCNCTTINISSITLTVSGNTVLQKYPIIAYRDSSDTFNVFVTPPLSVTLPRQIPRSFYIHASRKYVCLDRDSSCSSSPILFKNNNQATLNGSKYGSLILNGSDGSKTPWLTVWYSVDYCANMPYGSYFNCTVPTEQPLRCQDAYYGAKCDVYCFAKRTRYSCNRATGAKLCRSGFEGDDCVRVDLKLELIVVASVLGVVVTILVGVVAGFIKKTRQFRQKHEAVTSFHVKSEMVLQKKISTFSLASTVAVSPESSKNSQPRCSVSPYGDYEANYLDVLPDNDEVGITEDVFVPPSRKQSIM